MYRVVHRRAVGPQRGMILVPVLFLTFLLAVLSFNFLNDGLLERSDVDYSEHRLRALEIAEQGLLRAEMELRSGSDPDGDGCGTLTGSFGDGTYRVQASVLDAGQDLHQMIATGNYRNATRRIEVGIRKPKESLFLYAMFGKEWVKATGGSHTDSYDSDVGTWLSQVMGVDAEGLPYASVGGHAGSNGYLVVSGPIRGDAIPGPGGYVDHGEAVWGSTDPREEPAEVPDPPYEDFQAAFLENDNLSIDTSNPKVAYDPDDMWLTSGGGAPITLTGGTYLFNTLKMTGGGNLIVTGPTKIYITNHFEISGGGIANMTGVPANCLIYAHPHDFPVGSRHDKMKVLTSGGSETSLAIYAPTFHVEMSGGGTLYGAMVGNTIVISGGSAFHYDEALGRLGGGSGTQATERVYWLER